MRKLAVAAVLTVVAMVVAACSPPSQSSADLVLPEGDAERGQQLFADMGCVDCHTVRGVEFASDSAEGPVKVMLGSRTKIKSYGELVTSVVNPSHRLAPRYREEEVSSEGESLMVVYNDVMTVTQLTDIVAFLRSRYENLPRPGYRYPTYKYGKTGDGSSN